MAESSRRRKTTTGARRRRDTADDNTAEPILPPRPQILFSSGDQYERYTSNFSNRDIIEPRYIDIDYFSDQNFEFFDILNNLNLLRFLGDGNHYYPELVRVFYSNLRITDDGCILSEVKKVPIRVDPNLFYDLTHLGSQGVHFEGSLAEEWKLDYSTVDAKRMICRENANIGGRILAGQMKVESRVLHYIICRCLLPRSTNLAQATEEDIILMWAIYTGRQINWAHLVRNRMKKALRDNAPLPYPHFITNLFEYFDVPVEDEPFQKDRKRIFKISGEVIQSFGFVRNQNDEWVHKRDLPPRPQHDERTPSPPPHAIHDPSSAMLTDIMHGIRDLRAYVGNRFDDIDARVGRLEEDMSYVRRHFPPS